MSQELLYTSAPHGLKPGSRGFCTVLSTQGMPAPLASGLEALSGYRPVFPASDSRAHLNPVVQSHVILPVAGRSWHVLSRIADYGLDYSQRTNKLAHHVVLDPGELTENGPAHLIGSPAFMRTEWDDEAKLVPPKVVKKTTAAPVGVCRAWKELTGDAGWAGVLAESFLRDPERPVFLLYEPGQDLLPLITESIALLPPEKRWEVTFSTYFTGLPQGVNCTWRCLLKGSPEANQSLRFPRALRIDLTSESIGAATGGHLVEAARDGVPARVDSQKSSVQPNNPVTNGTPDQPDLPEDSSSDATDNSGGKAAGALPPALAGNVFKPYQLADKPANSGPPRRRTLADVDHEIARSSRKTRLVLAVVFAALLLVAVGVGLIWTGIPRRWNGPQFALDAAVATKAKVTSQANESSNVPPPSPPAPSKEGGPSSPKPQDLKPSVVSGSNPKPQEQQDAVPSVPAAAPGRSATSDMVVSPASNTTSLCPETRVTIDPHRSKITELNDKRSDTDPYSQLILWAPPKMFLQLKNKNKTSSPATPGKYIVNEMPDIQLALIESVQDSLGKKDGLERFTLRLKPVAAAGKVKRLDWCELDIPGASPTTIKFHQFPLLLSTLETKLSGIAKTEGRYQLQWSLGAESSDANVPDIRVEKLSLKLDNKVFALNPLKPEPPQATKQIANWRSKQLDEHLRNMLTPTAASKLPPSYDALSKLVPIEMKIETIVSKKHNESGLGDVSIVFTLSGWDDSFDKIAVHQRQILVGIVNDLKRDRPFLANATLAKSDLEGHTNIVIKMIEDAEVRLKSSNKAETVPSKLDDELGRLGTAKGFMKLVINDYKNLLSLATAFKNCEMMDVSLYYDAISKGNDVPRKIYIITDSK